MDWKATVKLLLLLLVLISPTNATANVSVFACEPEWKALAEEIGRESVSVFSATTAKQDPHRIQARPSLIAKLRRADLLICTGADLETGWLPLLVRRARNPKVQAGRIGHLMAAEQVTLLEVPKSLDRSAGDIHADGNPHLHLDPRNLLKVAEALAHRLSRIDPNNEQSYRSNLSDFHERWTNAIRSWETLGESLSGRTVVVHHKEWIYLLNWLGMMRMEALEPKAGLPPSAGHLAGLKTRLEHQPALAIIRSSIDNSRPSEWLSQKTGTPAVVLPYTVGGTPDTKDLFTLFEISITRLVELTR
jgi:zinc/manganese transport system substrate-binding protein